MDKVNGEQTVETTEPAEVVTEPTTPVSTDPAGVVDIQKTPETEPPKKATWTGMLPDKYKNDPRFSEKPSFLEALDSILEPTKEPAPEPDGKKVEPVDTSEYTFTKTFDKEMDNKGVFENSILATIKDKGLTAEQADLLHSAMADGMASSMEAFKKAGAEDCATILHETWADKYDVQTANAKKAYSRLVPEGSPLDKNLKLTQVENNPFVQQLLAKIGEGLSEASIPLSNNSVFGRKDTGSSFLQEEKGGFKPY